jgi:hypothetical protein
MFNFARLSLGLVARCFRSRRRLLLENLALRQQLAVLKRRRARPKLSPFDKLFWVLACRFWTDWKGSLLVVTPETVVRWQTAKPCGVQLRVLGMGKDARGTSIARSGAATAQRIHRVRGELRMMQEFPRSANEDVERSRSVQWARREQESI